MTLVLRAVEPGDREFLRQVYASTRTDELAHTGWDAATCAAFVDQQFSAQERHYQAQFPRSDYTVIERHRDARSTPVGRLWVDRRVDAIHVLDIALLAPYRGQGLGTACLQQLMAQARGSRLPLTITVEFFNPARRLYQRLGFVPTAEHGIHIAMSWQAVPVQVKETEDEQA